MAEKVKRLAASVKAAIVGRHRWGTEQACRLTMGNQEQTVIFSHTARILAVLGVILGALRVLMGLSIANGWMGLTAADLARYTTAATTGKVIDQGFHVILAAVVLGTLAEIGLALRK